MQPQRIRNAVVRDVEAVRTAIGRAAQRTGADFTYLLSQAKTESGLDPNAKASTSSATGLFQFIDQSWLGVLKQHGGKHGYAWAADAIRPRAGGGFTCDPAARSAIFALRRDPECASLMAGEFAQDNAAGLERALGRQPNSADLYFAHFLGLKGASRFLKAADANPDAPAASLFPQEARANRSIFYTRSGEARSLGQVYALMGKKIGGGTMPERAIPDRIEAPLQMASLSLTRTPLSPTPTDEVRLVDLPQSQAPQATATALADRRGGMDPLRPSPQTAMLAYLMIAGRFDA